MKTNRKRTDTTSVWKQYLRQKEKRGERWGHCLWLTQGGSAFKSLHHLCWFLSLRCSGFKDLHSCDVNGEKRGRNGRAGGGDGGRSPPLCFSSPSGPSIPETQASKMLRRALWGSTRLVSSSSWHFCGTGPGTNADGGLRRCSPLKKKKWQPPPLKKNYLQQVNGPWKLYP